MATRIEYRVVPLFAGLFFIGLVFGSAPAKEAEPGEKVIFRETFDYPNGALPEAWWSEGDAALIRNSRLHVNADGGQFKQSTVWLNREFSGNLRVEYDACVLNSGDTANNLNFFFLYSDPSGKPLRESSQARANGNYNHYHSLNGYIFTNVADGTETAARFRFRDCPGFHLVAEKREYENRRNTVYHITIEKQGSRFVYKINGKAIMETTDGGYNPIHKKGLIAVRTWHTELWLDNLVVTQLLSSGTGSDADRQ